MTYKQVIIDRYEVEKEEMIDERTRVLDVDVEDIADISGYTLEDRFENMFSPDLFREGRNHVITVELYRVEDDECTDDPIYVCSFRSPYQG
jgi:hypothetical protein